MNSQSLRSEPFLWIHLAGIAAFPIFVGLTILGLSIGNSYSWVLELSLLGIIGIFPILLMQLIRPFDIFSILLLSLKPESLSDRQRKILSLFKRFRQKVLTVAIAVIMLITIWLIYYLSPVTVGIANFLPQQRLLGLAMAGASFFASNLFLQIPLGVLLVLRTKESKLATIAPYPVDKIEQNFTVAGFKLDKILWFLELPEDSLDIKSS